jgi:iron uptake system EfeUOB component EfeO/EfeM
VRWSRTLDGRFAAVEASLAPHRVGAGYRPYTALTAADRTTMKAQLAALGEDLSKLPAALGLG